MNSMHFDRCKLPQLALEEVRAPGGIGFARIAAAGALAGRFVLALRRLP